MSLGLRFFNNCLKNILILNEIVYIFTTSNVKPDDDRITSIVWIGVVIGTMYSMEWSLGYKINALQQTECLVVNPITVGNFAFLFNCTPVGRTSDSMTVPTLRLIY